MYSEPVLARCSLFDDSLQKNLDQAIKIFEQKYPPGSRKKSDIEKFKRSITEQLEDDLLSQKESSKKTARHLMGAFLYQIDVFENIM